MAIRERAKALFKSRPKSDGSSQLSKSSSGNSSSTERDRWPSNVYKPGEAMPRPKYRAPPKKEHKEKLEAFSFAEAWRRKSFQSQYSPMGTRAPSRRNSSRRNSFLSIGRKSFSKGDSSRTDSVASGDTGKSGVRQREYAGIARPTVLHNQAEQDGDDDVANVGGSRLHSIDYGSSRPRTAEGVQPYMNGLAPTISTAHDHHPFSEHDLALALHRSHLAVPAVPAH